MQKQKKTCQTNFDKSGKICDEMLSKLYFEGLDLMQGYHYPNDCSKQSLAVKTFGFSNLEVTDAFDGN